MWGRVALKMDVLFRGIIKANQFFLSLYFIAGGVKGPVSILPHLSVRGRSIIKALFITSSSANRFCGHRPAPDVCSGPQISERALGQGLALCVCPEVMRYSAVPGQVMLRQGCCSEATPGFMLQNVNPTFNRHRI